jgi:hypothetical protein
LPRWTRCAVLSWRSWPRVSPSTTFRTSCSWFAEETYQTSLAPYITGA